MCVSMFESTVVDGTYYVFIVTDADTEENDGHIFPLCFYLGSV